MSSHRDTKRFLSGLRRLMTAAVIGPMLVAALSGVSVTAWPRDPGTGPRASFSALTNSSHIAAVGPHDRISYLGSFVRLSGAISRDPDGDALAYIWSFAELPVASNLTTSSLVNPLIANLAFKPDVLGTHVLSLAVDDGRGVHPPSGIRRRPSGRWYPLEKEGLG